MKKFKNIFFYIIIIGGFSALMYWITEMGSKLEIRDKIATPVTHNSYWSEFLHSIIQNIGHPLAILLAQIVTIIFVARIFGWICKKIGQPTVIGEIIAGIVLGPSLIGMYFPEFSAAIFPAQSLGNLNFLSQIGLILFMFIVGMEIDINVLRNKAHDAVVISHASIIIPFALGMGLAYFIYEQFAPAGVRFSSFGLFIGIAMSITAFPVLARIVQERGIHKTRLGTVVITCAAADDITGWSILAAVIAVVKAGSFVSSLYTILLALAYVILMIKIVRPFLKRIGDMYVPNSSLSKSIIAIFFVTLILSAWTTEIIGIHALFGAFMVGTIMPVSPRFRNLFIEKIEDVALVLLLPLFFVFTGLRTEIGLLNDAYLWKITALIIGVAITGKFVGSAIAAKFVGQSWKDSLTIGALMNTRGLMELVVLNIGYDLGILTPKVFAIMVIMALVTTLMTGPALELELINKLFKAKTEERINEINRINKFRILVSFGNPENGKSLVRLADYMMKKTSNNTGITAMHLFPSAQSHHYNLDEYEHESFSPIFEESKKLNRKVATLFKVTNDIETDITEIANKGEYDLLLIGIGQSIFEGSLLGKILGFTTRIINPDRLINQVTGKENLFENSPFDERTRSIISKSKISVGVLIDKDFSKADTICIPIITPNDIFLMSFAQKLIKYSGSQISFIDVNNHINNNAELKELIRAIEQIAPNHVNLTNEQNINIDFIREQNLMLISMESWKNLLENKSIWLTNIPSTLIITEKEQ
jgi:Kef-type K+ transport system membrane component KefB